MCQLGKLEMTKRRMADLAHVIGDTWYRDFGLLIAGATPSREFLVYIDSDRKVQETIDSASDYCIRSHNATLLMIELKETIQSQTVRHYLWIECGCLLGLMVIVGGLMWLFGGTW